ncbi:MAG: thiamine biosynthesis lipoprotein [Halioglobus sp.]
MERIEQQFVAMGGLCRLKIDCDDPSLAQKGIAASQGEVFRLEKKYSRYLKDSITQKINALAGTGEALDIDSETAGLLQYADTLWRHSDGSFDISSGILRQAWNFKTGRVPLPSDLEPLLRLIGWENVTWNAASVYLGIRGMEIDLGGFVKEYACDSVARILRGMGLNQALVDLAGDIAVTGTQHSGDPWLIGIRQPNRKSEAIAKVGISHGGLASSGDYERCIEMNGKRYGHILDPKTGWPIEGLTAVSIIADQCLVAGSAATMAMLKPQPLALEWLAQLGLPWFAVDRHMRCYGQIFET